MSTLPDSKQRIGGNRLSLATLLVPLAFALAPAASAQVVVGTCDEAHLRTAITTVTQLAGGTVTFSCSGTITVASPLTIATPAAGITIDGTGQNVTISGGGSVQILQVQLIVGAPTGTLTLDSLTFANGSTTNSGGAIQNGATLTVNTSTFIANTSTGIGGAFENTGTLIVNNSTFSDNTASGGGGAIENGGILTVNNCTFSSNSSTGGGGGAIGSSGNLTLSNSSFSGNTANLGGAVSNALGALTIDSSTFVNNAATTEGGAVDNNNTLTVSDSTFSGNTANGFGGGIDNVEGAVTVTFTTFSANGAGTGGNVYNNGGTVNLSDTIIAGAANGGNCRGTAVTDGGYNLDDGATCGFTVVSHSLSSTNPQLGPLANNGGPTQTLALLANSPAIDQIPSDTNGCGTNTFLDQRGVPRPLGAGCDIGAYEFIPSIVSPPSLTFTSVFGGPAPAPQTVNVGSPGFAVSLSATASSTSPSNVNWVGVAIVPPASTPAVLTVTANPAGLPVGQALGNVTVSETFLFDGPSVTAVAATIPVTYNILSGVQLSYACPAAFTIGSGYLIPATVSGGTAPYAFSLISGLLPPGLVLTTTGLIAGTVVGSPSVYSFTIKAADSGSGALQQTATFSCTIATVPPAAPSLLITSTCPASPIAQNTSFTETLTATGGTGTYSWAISTGSLPGGLVLTGNTISGTVTGSPGMYSFSVQVSSGVQVLGLSCSLTVTPAKLQLTSGCPGNGVQGVAYGPFTVSATGGLGASSYSFAIGGSLPAGVSLSGNVIGGTPQASGVFSFSIQVSSGTQTASVGPCSVAITPPTLAIAGTCPVTAQIGAPISVPISATGGKSPYTFSFSGAPGLGFSNGAVSGSIAAAGPASFSVTVNDSANSPPATLSCSFTVTASLQITGNCPATTAAPGVKFSLPLTGSGGTPPYGWSLSGPSWLSLSGTTGSSISITGTPPATGSFPFSVTLTDRPGSPAASLSCTLIVKSSLLITASAGCPASPLPLQSIFSLSFTASGGTSPYSWAFSGPTWLALITRSGVTATLSGTAPGAGSFPFTVTLTDSANSIPAVFSCTIAVIPNLSLTGSNPSQDPTMPVVVGLSLSSPAPGALTGTVQLTFTPNATNPIDNPQVTFSDPCGRTCPFTIPAGQTGIPLPNVQQGTVAGMIQVKVISLFEGTLSVLPANPTPLDLTVPRMAPVLTSGSLANQTNSGFNIVLAGYSTPRDMNSVSITFVAAPGATIQGGDQFTLDVSSLFTNFYQAAKSTAGGSTFTGLTIPIALSGDIAAIGSVTVTMTNSAGPSTPLSLQH